MNLLKSCRVNNFVDTKLILVILSRKTEVIKFKFAVVADPLCKYKKRLVVQESILNTSVKRFHFKIWTFKIIRSSFS